MYCVCVRVCVHARTSAENKAGPQSKGMTQGTRVSCPFHGAESEHAGADVPCEARTRGMAGAVSLMPLPPNAPSS